VSEIGNAYSKIADTQNKVIQGVTRFTRDFFPFIILVLNILLTIGSSLFKTWIENPFTPEFFIALGTNILSTMLCYTCFVKYGETNEKRCSAAYAGNVKKWSIMSADVRSKMSDSFNRYCKELAKQEREEKRHSVISNHTMISIEDYTSHYKGKSRKEIKKLVKSGELTRIEGKYINKANATNKVIPINPLLILCGVQTSNINDVGRSKISYSTLSIISRPVSMFILTAVITTFKGTWIGVDDASAIFDMIYSAFMILISSVLGYSSGATTARVEHDKIKGRIYFLEKFTNNPTGEA
jgi:hypothetical protein